MQIHNITLPFKENRTYIQGPDLFNVLMDYFPEETLTDITCTLHKLIKNNHGQMYISDSLQEFKNVAKGSSATIYLNAAGTSYWIAFMFAEEMPVNSVRLAYDENLLIRLCRIDDKKIELNEKSPYTFVETIVSMHKKLLQTLYPDAGKWLFTKLVLTNHPRAQKAITITFSHNFNFKLVKSLIRVDDQPIGEIYFSLAESESSA